MQIFWVDAFTDTVGKGNPAAVVPLDAWLPDATLQGIALENGLSETAFFTSLPGVDDAFQLRWMTPEQEVDLCGHATLATAHVIFTQFPPRSPAITFHTLSGPLVVTKSVGGEGRYTMAFPSRPPIPVADIPLELLEGLGLAKEEVLFCGKARDYLLELKSPLAVAQVVPNYGVLNRVDALCIIISAPGDDDGGCVDVVSRVFCPNCGVPEDPVTGSAHCTVAPYFMGKLGKTRLIALQASQRSGTLELELSSDRTTVSITGSAVMYLTGVIKGVAGPPTPLHPDLPIATSHAISTLLSALAGVHADPRGVSVVASLPPPPRVTLTYAQSLDGSLAAVRGAPTSISCPTSLLLTHRLRAMHEGILVGYPTVLSDNPSLTVRLCPGVSPTVVVLDPDLRCPPGCRLFSGVGGEGSPITPPSHRPILLYGEGEGGEEFEARRAALVAAGAHPLKMPLLSGGEGGGRQLDLGKAMQALALPPFSLRSVLVEGGAGVHHSFLSQHSTGVLVVSAVVVTVAPVYLRGGLHIGGGGGGSRAPPTPSPHPPPFPLNFICSEKVGSDLVLLAQPA